MTPAPNPEHQRVSLRLTIALHEWVRRHPPAELFVAPIDLILSDDTVLQPDLLVVLEPEAVTGRGIERPPALAVEILSRSTRGRDRGLKRERYARAGVAEYWTVDPQTRAVGRHELRGGRLDLVEELGEGATLRSSALAGLELAVGGVLP